MEVIFQTPNSQFLGNKLQWIYRKMYDARNRPVPGSYLLIKY